MMSPIAQLVQAAGVAATITTPATADASNYDPNSGSSFAPGANATTGVVVVPSKLTEAMLASGYKAHFLAETIPSTVVPGKSSLTFDSVTYKIMEARKRFYVGVHDGWSLECAI